MSNQKIPDPSVVAVRFQPMGKVYYFNAADLPDLRAGDFVIVSTSRGRELGETVAYVGEPGEAPNNGWKPIERRATAQELVMRRVWQKRELEVLIACRAKAAETGLRSIKVAKAEFSYDGSRLTFLYATDGDDKPDLKVLRREMQRKYRKSKIEFRQVGPRDVAKLIGGLGACGMEVRCCSRFLTEFSPISIKMAKAQGISLNPQEITGICGRLRCCLLYEYEQYAEARKHLPKLKKRVVTPSGEGRVVEVRALKNCVVVQLENGTRAEFEKDDIQPYKELKALEKKAKAPCGKHAAGACTCKNGNGADG